MPIKPTGNAVACWPIASPAMMWWRGRFPKPSRIFRDRRKTRRGVLIVCDHNDDARHEQPDERGEVEIVRRAWDLIDDHVGGKKQMSRRPK